MVKKKLIDYIEGKLPGDEIQSIEEHRKNCVECDFLIKQFSAIWSEIPRIERLQPSDSFWRGLQAKIQAFESPQFISDKIFASLKMILRPAALFMILLAGIFFGYQMGNIKDDFGDISKSEVIDADMSGKFYVENYFQDFQEIPTGSPAEFYLHPVSYKKE
jgi:hypothetical protein